MMSVETRGCGNSAVWGGVSAGSRYKYNSRIHGTKWNQSL